MRGPNQSNLKYTEYFVRYVNEQNNYSESRIPKGEAYFVFKIDYYS